MNVRKIKPDGTEKIYTILIVEDDETSFILLQALLEPFNCRLLFAADGNQAVALCISHPEIDLVLMDLKLPLLSGYEATRQIRAFNPDVPIIAQTAYALSGDNEKALAAGCNNYITKPIKKEELLAKIGLYLDING
jgi:two-component system, cell cycle response regulator DivK